MNINFLSRRQFLSALAPALASVTIAITLVPTSVMAYDENSTASINVDPKGVALQGFDPVTYFGSLAPQKGSSGFTAVHDGATYTFASNGNREKFMAAPEKYAPQFGGFCAMGVALGKKFDVDPNAYKVVDGKLYLNLNKEVQKRWIDDVPGNIKIAEKSWPALKGLKPKGL